MRALLHPKGRGPTATVTSIFEGPQQSDVPGTSTQSDFPSGLPETQKEDQPALLPDHSPKVTVTHSQLKKAEKQCFCGEMCASLEELAAHKSLQHYCQGGWYQPKNQQAQGSMEVQYLQHGLCWQQGLLEALQNCPPESLHPYVPCWRLHRRQWSKRHNSVTHHQGSQWSTGVSG